MASTAPSRDRILDEIYAAIDALNETQPADRQVAKVPEAQLFGQDGSLDSYALVTLIIDVEQRLNDAFDAGVTLADERAMSQRNSPFRSVAALADYAEGLLKDDAHG